MSSSKRADSKSSVDSLSLSLLLSVPITLGSPSRQHLVSVLNGCKLLFFFFFFVSQHWFVHM